MYFFLDENSGRNVDYEQTIAKGGPKMLSKEELLNMLPASLIGDIFTELTEKRGISRSELAARLKVKPPVISQYKAGDAYPKDQSLPIIAKMHGGYTTRELLTHKWVYWIMREKGITIPDIQRVLNQKAA